MKAAAILLAGGTGHRMGNQIAKQYLKIHDKPIITYSFDLFSNVEEITEIIVVCRKEYDSLFPSATFARPGSCRQESMTNGFFAMKTAPDYCLIHDACRPLITKKQVLDCLNGAKESGASALGVPLRFTIKKIDHEARVQETPNRSLYWEVQTPQVIKTSYLFDAIEHAKKENLTFTDDVSLVETQGIPVKMVEGCPRNLKVTIPQDLKIAELLLEEIHS